MRERLASKGLYGAVVWRVNEAAIVALAAVGALFSAEQYPSAPLAVFLLLGPVGESTPQSGESIPQSGESTSQS
eukprot:738220-Pyramimonas_sp.AAC.1